MLGGEVSSSSSQRAFLPEGPRAGAAPLGLEIEAVYLASRDGYETRSCTGYSQIRAI
jgi:hypothetical protein